MAYKQPIMEAANTALQPIPVAISGALVMGITVEDWVLIITLLVLLFNLFWMGVRVYDRFIKKEQPQQKDYTRERSTDV